VRGAFYFVWVDDFILQLANNKKYKDKVQNFLPYTIHERESSLESGEIGNAK